MAFFDKAPGRKSQSSYKKADRRDGFSRDYKKSDKPSYGKNDKPSYSKSEKPSYGKTKDFYGKSENPSYGKAKEGYAKFSENSYKSSKPNFDSSSKPSYTKYQYKSEVENKKPLAKTELKPAYNAEPALEANENMLVGRNPIREAIKSGRDIEKILVLKGDINGSAREIVSKARDNKIVVQEVEKQRLDALAQHHQGMIAFASAYKYHDVEDMLNLAKEKGEEPFIVMLDGITDPHNLGAIIRTAECAGAHGVIIPSRRAVGLTSTVVKASAGAIEHIMVAKVTNLVGMIESLKRKGLWVYAADMDGDDYKKVDYSGSLLLVIGAEGSGVSTLVLQNCDKKISVPLRGKIDSLNASVATGILMFEALKGR